MLAAFCSESNTPSPIAAASATQITSLLSKLFDITLQQSASSPEVGESLIGAEHVTPEAAAASENVKSVAQLYGVLLSTS